MHIETTTPGVKAIAEGFESLALTLLPSPRENAAAILGANGPRLSAFGLRPLSSMDRPPLRDGLIECETAIAKAAVQAGRGPAGLALNLAKSETTRMIAMLSAHVLGAPPDAVVAALGVSALVVAGHLRRALEGGAAEGSG